MFERIVAHRELGDGGLEFKVQWAGDWEPTWEPRENLPEEAVSRYFIRYRRAFKKQGPTALLYLQGIGYVRAPEGAPEWDAELYSVECEKAVHFEVTALGQSDLDDHLARCTPCAPILDPW